MLGTFARVEKRVIDNKCVAYKIYSRAHGSLVYQHFLRERDTLKQLNITNKDSYKHHIIELLDVQETNTHHVLIFPFYDTTLESFVHTKNKTLAHQFLDQISKALSYIHQQGIVHCDLSPQNILLGSGCMFLSDFGCAQRINTPHTTTDIGTRLYKAPEHLFGYRTYSSSTDLWSFGVIFLQLMIGYPIFAGESDIEQIARIVFRLGRPSLEVEQEEMWVYPDINKLDFFSLDDDDDDEDIEFDSEQEQEEFKSIRKPLQAILDQENISKEDQNLALNLVNWSRSKRSIGDLC